MGISLLTSHLQHRGLKPCALELPSSCRPPSVLLPSSFRPVAPFAMRASVPYSATTGSGNGLNRIFEHTCLSAMEGDCVL
jgi:hypothetical protein